MFMKWLTFILLLAVVGCNKKEELPMFSPPPSPTIPAPVQPQPIYSPSYLKGYNDGYSGAWLSPASWVVASEYRSGWTAGKKDKDEGKAHKFNK